MTKRSFVILLLRIFAIYLIFRMLEAVGQIITHPSQPLINYLIDPIAILMGILLFSFLVQKSKPLLEQEPIASTASESPSSSLQDVMDLDKLGIQTETEIETKQSTELGMATSTAERTQLIVISLIGIWEVINNLSGLSSPLGLTSMLDGQSNIAKLFVVGFSFKELLSRLFEVSLGIWLYLRPWRFQRGIKKVKAQGA